MHRIAITYDANGEIFQHFGVTKHLKIYDVENKQVVVSEVIDTGSNGHGAMAAFLKSLGVETLICGGIGGGAKNALTAAGIEFFPYVQGRADEQVQAYLAGRLVYDLTRSCASHSHGQDDAHACQHHDHEQTEAEGTACAARATCDKHKA